MKAMILAAGRGERMRPLTDHTPKPLLEVGGKSLIVHHIEALARAGIVDIVINHAWLGQQMEQRLGQGQQFGVNLLYSAEGETGLETAGGIRLALPLLGPEPFLVINGDVLSSFEPQWLIARTFPESALAHLVLVPNPAQHPAGDFAFAAQAPWLSASGEHQATFSGIAWYRPEFFTDVPAGPQKLAPYLRQAMARQQVSGELYTGYWADIGTPERLEQADRYWRQQQAGCDQDAP